MNFFRKILAFSLSAVTVLTLSLGAFAAEFCDVPKRSWYVPYVTSAAEAGLMNGTGDTSIFSVCSDYQYKSYLHALGYRIFGAKTYMDSVTDSYWLHSADAGMLLIRWAREDYSLSKQDKAFGVTQESFSTTEEFLAFVADWKNTMRPGDIIMNSTHALFYVGSGYMTDVSGEKYRMYGLDAIETGGAIDGLISLEEWFFAEYGNYNLLSLDGTGKVSSTTVMVQVENEKLVTMTSDGKAAVVVPYDYLRTLNQFLAMDFFVVLRPTLAAAELG